jgi:hypothetical protein
MAKMANVFVPYPSKIRGKMAEIRGPKLDFPSFVATPPV